MLKKSVFAKGVYLFIFQLGFVLGSCGQARNHNSVLMQNNMQSYELATLGGGCFWCLDAIFKDVKGVGQVVSGYSGGHIRNPAYREVTSGRTGHAEVVQLRFDPEIISYAEILNIFFHLHDPTTLNRQGADVGTQYRSVIFFHDQDQELIAREVFAQIDATDLWPGSLVTEIAPLINFYPAEDYHQDYFAKNPDQPYCSVVIGPKVAKMRKYFKDYLRD